MANWFTDMLKSAGNAIGGAIAPDQAELDAAANGRRWNYALEHRFLPPGSKFTQQVMQGAALENQQKPQLQQSIASERYRTGLFGMWRDFINKVRAGNYDEFGGTSEGAREWADRFKQQFDDTYGPGSSDMLMPLPEVLGDRKELARKQVFDIKEGLNYTTNILNNINSWMQDGSWNDPIKQGMIKNYLDKTAQSLAARLGGDSKSMADAEKVRIQILSLPEESMKMVHQEVANYRDFLSSIMEYGRQKGWSQNIIGKINRGKDSLEAALKTDNKGNISTFVGEAMSTIGDIMPSLTPAERELAIGLNEALTAGIEAHKQYMYNMTLAADVDPAFVYQLARTLHEQYATQFNNEMENMYRPERAKAAPTQTFDLKDLVRQVKPSPLLTPNNYKNMIVEYMRPEGSHGNPQGKIEQKPGKRLPTKSPAKPPPGGFFINRDLKEEDFIR